MPLVTTYQDNLDSLYALASAEPQSLEAVYEKITDKCREALALRFSSKTLLVTANPEDDTISVRCEDEISLKTQTWKALDVKKPWKSLIGTSFGWGWVTVNQQGYCDGVLLSFDGLLPTVLLNVSGSSISVSQIVQENGGNSSK